MYRNLYYLSILCIEKSQQKEGKQKRNSKSSKNLESKNSFPYSPSSKKYKDEIRDNWWGSQEINLSSSFNIFSETDSNKNTESVQEKQGFMQKFVQFFGLSILKDPVLVNIIIGLSIAFCAETNFTLLLPIILKDMLKFETTAIGQIIALVGFMDTLCRLLSPLIAEWLKLPPRIMYIIGLLLITIVRTGEYYQYIILLSSVKYDFATTESSSVT
jgi:hypothetical protein